MLQKYDMSAPKDCAGEKFLGFIFLVAYGVL